MTARLLSVDNTPAATSGHATQVYLMASLQRLLTAVPHARLYLVSAFVVPKLLFLASLGHQPNAQTDMLYGVANQKGFTADVGIHVQASQMLTGMSLGLLSQLVMANAAADAFVVQQASFSTLCIIFVFFLLLLSVKLSGKYVVGCCSLPPSLSPPFLPVCFRVSHGMLSISCAWFESCNVHSHVLHLVLSLVVVHRHDQQHQMLHAQSSVHSTHNSTARSCNTDSGTWPASNSNTALC